MSTVELDPPPPTKKLFDRRQSFRDIQNAISKMNPKVVKTVIESGKRPLPPTHYQLGLHPPSLSFSMSTAAPLTIFYNGTVNVFHVSALEAEAVMKLAHGKETQTSLSHPQLHSINQGKIDSDESCIHLKIARKKSLQRFLKKRKGRTSLVSQ